MNNSTLLEKLTHQINTVKTKIPFYQDLYKSVPTSCNFEDIPFITKDMLATTNLEYWNRQDYLEKYNTGQLRQGRSSGTTGKLTTILYDPIDHIKSLQELWFYRLKWYNIKPQEDKVLLFYPTDNHELKKIDTKEKLALSKPFLFSENRILNALKIIRESKPDYCIIQPSTAVLFYKTWEKYNLSPILEMRYIEFNGEFLENTVIKNIKKVFPNAQVSNQYGLQELQSVAFTCPHGNMHLMTSNCYTEIVNKDENGIGDICLTTLKNKVMPYIRFITGDKGYITTEKCPCGCNNPILHLTRGRDNDFIRRPNGELLHPYIILQSIEAVTNDLLQYRVTQTDYNNFIFDLVLANKNKQYIVETKLTKILNIELKDDITVQFNYFDTLFPERNTGKQTVFICTMEDE